MTRSRSVASSKERFIDVSTSPDTGPAGWHSADEPLSPPRSAPVEPSAFSAFSPPWATALQAVHATVPSEQGAPDDASVPAEPDLSALSGASTLQPAAQTGALATPAAPGGPKLGPTGRPLVDFPLPPALESHGPARVIAVCNQKGGVGKTTSTVNLGAALAEYGRRVLLVDLDPQGALTVGVGVDPFSLGDNTVYRLLKDLSVPATEVLLKTDTAGLDLLPANIDLSVAEVELVSEIARERRLLDTLTPLLPDYDVVLIDCQPSLGLLTINALAASHGVLIPLECEYYALRGVSLLMDSIQKVRRAINPGLEIEGFLATMYDGRTLHSREVLQMLVQTFPDDVLHTVISRTIRFPESSVGGRPITSYAPSSSGAEAYRQLAREILAAAPASPTQGSAD
jgi:chromosome partitioning protein